MHNKSGFRVRLSVRIAKALTTEATSLSVMVSNKEVRITSQTKEEPLNQATSIVLDVRGFTEEGEAQRFGARLCSILQLAALSSRLGVDAGENKPTSWVNEEFARSSGWIEKHERIAPNIHGLMILPDDDNTRILILNFQGKVTADPEQFTSALRESGESGEIVLGTAANGVRLLNLALMTTEPITQIVLALSAVEELGQNQKWSMAQISLINHLADAAEASQDVSGEERKEVARAIRTGLFPLSLRQGVLRLLSRLDLDHLRKEWDRLYTIRSGLFHGTALLPRSEIDQAAHDTMTLCGRIILAIAANEGARVPSIATTHFDQDRPAVAQK